MKNNFKKVAAALVMVLSFISLFNSRAQAQFITTIAGNGYGAPNSGGYAGDGFLAINAQLYEPAGLALDTAENVYIVDLLNNVIRKVTKSTGIITTIAGNGHGGYSGDGGPATDAELNIPTGVAVDDSGNVFIADAENSRIRKVRASTGVIITVAGIDTAGFSGDGALAINAKIHSPTGLALDNSGNIYFADQINKRVRKVDASTGIITTIAGTGTAGNTGNGGLATAATLGIPYSVALDKAGNIYISDLGNYNIRKITVATGIITTIAGNGTPGFSGDGGPATTAELAYPEHMAVDSSGNIYIADILNHVVREVIAATGIITTVAGNDTAGFSGDGGPAVAAKLNSPCAVALDKAGKLYIGDTKNNRVRKIVECNVSGLTIHPPSPSICSGNKITLKVTGGSTGYTWSPATNLNKSAGDSVVLTAPSLVDSLVYTVSHTGLYGCKSTASVTVKIGESVIPGNVTALRDTICAGTKGNLALVNSQGGPLQWQSSVNETTFMDISKADSLKYVTLPLQQTTWYRVLAGTGVCKALSDTIRLYVPPALTASFYSTQTGSRQISFNADSSAGSIRNYHWDFGDGGTSTVKNPAYTYKKDSTYYVCLTLYDGSNCSYTFCKYETVATAIPELASASDWNIYPNPFSGQLTVSSEKMNSRVQSIEMYDVLGRLMVSRLFSGTNNTLQLDVPQLADGIYFLLIKTTNGEYVQKVVKQ